MLQAGTTRKAPGDVAADHEGQKQRDQEPYEAHRPALCGRRASSVAQDRADNRPNYAAEDQASSQRRQPTEDYADSSWCPAQPLSPCVLHAAPLFVLSFVLGSLHLAPLF